VTDLEKRFEQFDKLYRESQRLAKELERFFKRMEEINKAWAEEIEEERDPAEFTLEEYEERAAKSGDDEYQWRKEHPEENF
jgi:ElaB/YqjD/DUF883 family membrane-anchored ribosome-binding protein